PVALLVASRSPDLFAGLSVQGKKVGLLIIVIHDVQPIPVEHRRGRGPPAKSGWFWFDDVLPKLLAVEIKAENSEIAEVKIDALACRDRLFGRLAVLEMEGGLGFTFVDLPHPKDFAGVQVEAEDLPLMHCAGRFWPVAAKVQTLLRFLGLARADH